jgi:hypothetical protein
MSLINLRRIGNKTAEFIRSPKTEMVLAFIIEMSKNYLFLFIQQLTGDQILYTVLQFLILLVPWIMLGHGAFRYEALKSYKGYSSLNNHNLPNPRLKINLNLTSFLFAAFIFMKLLIP